MPTSYEIKGGRVIVTSEGAFDLEESEAVTAALLADPAFAPGCALLIDARGAAGNASSSEISGQAGWFAALHREHFTRCAVVTSPGLHFGLARMFSSFVDATGLEVQVFDDVAAAERWLESG